MATTTTTLLTDEMRAATRKVHDISDKLVNVKLLIALTNNELYGRSVLLFFYVYAQLEQSLENCKDHEVLSEFQSLLPEFARAGSIAKDLKFFLGEDWSEKHKPTAAAVAYVKHLKELEKTNPTLLISYLYHMYTALLAGGQMIKKVVKKSFDPPEGEGLNTFDFKAKSRMTLRSALKDKVNAVKLDDTTKQLVLAESLNCFKMNNSLVRSIEGSGRQFVAWIVKWIVALGLIYLEGDEYAHPHAPSMPGHHHHQQQQHQPPYHQPPMPHMQQQGGYYPPPPYDHQRPGGFNNREPDFRGRSPRSESRGGGDMRGGGGGYDRYRGRGPGGNRSRSRSPPRGGGDQPQRQHRPSGEWERYDDPAPPKERRATQAIEPMDSYKVFMMRQDENSTPETYQQRYEEYKKKYVQRLMRAFFEDHKKEEWLQERYSPAIRHRLEVQKRSKKITEAKNFGERVRNGTAKICLDENADLPSKDFDNDMEDSARILYIRRIPCACPVTSLSESILGESIKKAGGNFQQIYLSDPVKKSAFDFDRSAYIVYDTPEAAAEALPKIHNTFVQDADTFAPFRLQVSQHRSRAPLKTPSYLSVPERLAFDCSQALTLATALDKCIFVKDADLKRFGIEALLDHDDIASVYTTEKQKLDVTVAYLRRVHHYIYYAGTQCLDMGDIMHAHPALFCRPEPTARDLEEAKARQESAADADESSESRSLGGWAASLDEKVQAYIKELEPAVLAEKKEKEQALVNEIEAREEAALETTYANYCEKAGDDGKHRCRLCTKLFKAADFVKKHIRNKHPELVVDKIAEVGESYMWEQYREDQNRPLPPIETTNNLTNPVLGGRGGSSSFQNRGGGGGRNGPYGGGPPRGGYRNDGPPGGGYRGRGPPRDNSRDNSRPRQGSFGSSNGPPRSPPRYNRPPERDLPVDPRQITKSYQDLDNLQDTKVELSFDALDSLPPPKKKTKA